MDDRGNTVIGITDRHETKNVLWSDMKGAGSAERSVGVGFSATIAADEGWIYLKLFDLLGFACFCQFAHMHCVIVRIGAQIVDIDETVTHGVILFEVGWWSFFPEDAEYNKSANLEQDLTKTICVAGGERI